MFAAMFGYYFELWVYVAGDNVSFHDSSNPCSQPHHPYLGIITNLAPVAVRQVARPLQYFSFWLFFCLSILFAYTYFCSM